MPVITFIEFDQAENVTNRRHAQIMRESLRFGMVKHVNKRMWDHFGHNAKTAPGGAYGFKARNQKYLKAKVKKLGRDPGPNIFSGKLRNYIRNTAQITATQHRSRARLKGPYWTVQGKNKNSGFTPERRREMEVIAESERADIANDVRGEYVKLLNDPSNRRLRRRKRI